MHSAEKKYPLKYSSRTPLPLLAAADPEIPGCGSKNQTA